MKNKKAQVLNTNVIILITLGIIILVILIAGFIISWDYILQTQEPHFKITKQNLTTKWLDENCECIDTNYIEYNEKCMNDKELEINLKRICLQWISFLEESECSKYKCGDYIVETWDQIK